MKQSFLAAAGEIDAIQRYSLSGLSADEVDSVALRCWDLINNLSVCSNLTKLVAGSKALHHILPDLVPPIDRTYTLKFFYGSTQVQTHKEGEKFREIFPLLQRIGRECNELIQKDIASNDHEMATSTTKVIDNAIVGYVKKYISASDEA